MTKRAIAASIASVGSPRRRIARGRADEAASFAFGIAGGPVYTRPQGDAASMNIIVVAGLIAVIVSLFSALYYLYHDRGQGTRMVTMLVVRVGLSAGVVVFLVIAYWMGWIAPTGLR